MFNNLKLSYKIWLGFGFILTITLILGVISSVNMLRSKNISTLLNNESMPAIELSVILKDIQGV